MATVSAVLYTSKKYAGDVYPIMVRVQHRKSKKYFKVGDATYNVQKRQWDDGNRELKRDKRINKNYEKQNFHIAQQVHKITEIIEDFEKSEIAWTFNLLQQKYHGNVNYTSFNEFAEARIKSFHEQKKYGSEKGYKSVLNALIQLLGEKKYNKLEIADIDVPFCEKLIAYGREEILVDGAPKQRWKESTIGTHLKKLGALLKLAIKENVGSPSTYPFSAEYGATNFIRIKQFKCNERHKYIPTDFMERFINYKCHKLDKMIYIKTHIFCCLLDGVKFRQLILTRQNAIQEQEIDGETQKALVLTKDQNGIDKVFPITREIQIILDWFERYTKPVGDYLLPILKKVRIGEQQRSMLYDRTRRKCNVIWELNRDQDLPECTLETFDIWNNVVLSSLSQKLTQKIFLFSYYAQGINSRDMAFIRTNDIQNSWDSDEGDYQYFVFKRAKTRKLIEVQISEKLREIIDWFKENCPPVENYLIPIITKPGLKDKALYDHISHQLITHNRNLKIIAKECGFPGQIQDLHMYFARHTYATTLRKKGVPIEVISEALGHSDLNITKVYLERFDHRDINKYNQML